MTGMTGKAAPEKNETLDTCNQEVLWINHLSISRCVKVQK